MYRVSAEKKKKNVISLNQYIRYKKTKQNDDANKLYCMWYVSVWYAKNNLFLFSDNFDDTSIDRHLLLLFTNITIKDETSCKFSHFRIEVEEKKELISDGNHWQQESYHMRFHFPIFHKILSVSSHSTH